MTDRDPRAGDAEALDRVVEEALALANDGRDAPGEPVGGAASSPAREGERAVTRGGGRPARRPAGPDEPPGAARAGAARRVGARDAQLDAWQPVLDDPPPAGDRPAPADPDPAADLLPPGAEAGHGWPWPSAAPDRTSRPAHLTGGRSGPGSGHSARDGHGTPGDTTATSWPAARVIAARAAAKAPPPTPVARSLAEALGQVLAEPLYALTDLPSFDTSAMDGWAVAGPGPWRLAADGQGPGILAGHGPAAALPDGHAVAIATGARIPPGATAVLRSEHGSVIVQGRGADGSLAGHRHGAEDAGVAGPGGAPAPGETAGSGAAAEAGRRSGSGGRRRADWLHAGPAHPVSPGQDIRPRGQECRSGDLLLPSGALITPAVLGLAAAAGYDGLAAVPRPRVEVLVLGDELLTEGLPRDGRIRDALGPMLGPWLTAVGAEVLAVRRLADDPEALYTAITGSRADLVLTTGGTAAGPVDHVHPTLRRIGAELLVDSVAVRPGHPMLLARLAPERLLVGLPGNPLAAVSGLLTLAEPLLRTLAGRAVPEACPAPLAAAVHGHPRDTRLVPVAFRADEAVPMQFNGPAMLRGVAVADALAVIPPGGAERGAEVEILDLPWAAGSGWPSWSAGATGAPTSAGVQGPPEALRPPDHRAPSPTSRRTGATE